MDFESQRCWAEKGVLGDASCARLEAVVHCRNCPRFESAAASAMAHLHVGVSAAGGGAKPDADAGAPLFVFRCAHSLFALSPEFVCEITVMSMVHRIPHRKGGIISGISNIDGELVPVVDIRGALGLPPSAPEGGGKMVLCGVSKDKFAFAVDGVLGVRKYVLPDAPQQPGETKKFISAEIRSADGAVSVLDAELLWSAAARREA